MWWDPYARHDLWNQQYTEVKLFKNSNILTPNLQCTIWMTLVKMKKKLEVICRVIVGNWKKKNAWKLRTSWVKLGLEFQLLISNYFCSFISCCFLVSHQESQYFIKRFFSAPSSILKGNSLVSVEGEYFVW